MLRLSTQQLAPALLTFGLLLTANGGATAHAPVTIEVFTATGVSVDANDDQSQRDAPVEVYEIDGTALLEAELSRGLPPEPEAAQRIALDRTSRLNEGQRQQIRRAALGLSKALQYGIDRYPAVVFDGQAVVYGATDLEQALRQYRQWQEASER